VAGAGVVSVEPRSGPEKHLRSPPATNRVELATNGGCAIDGKARGHA